MTAAYIYYTESLAFLTATPVIHFRKYFIYSINQKSIPEILNMYYISYEIVSMAYFTNFLSTSFEYCSGMCS